MTVLKDIILRLPLTNFDNIKYTINLLSLWLYELNTKILNKPRKYKNLSDKEYKSLYNKIELYIYKTNFSFTTYETNKMIVIICFIKEIYHVSLACAKQLFKIYKHQSNNSLIDIITTDRELYRL
jgi:hypothetical protein